MNRLPEDVRAFIAKHIVSLEELEVLLLLRASSDRSWTAAEINVQVRSQESSIAKWLQALATSGLASVTSSRYRFAPADDAMRERIAAVAEVYRSRRTTVIEFLFSKQIR